jgi:Txe/YoeB family toxin of Txe-Axe toxin-antitoxin module
MESGSRKKSATETGDPHMKPSKLVFISQKLEDSFAALRSDDPLKKSIIKAINQLKQDAFYGIQIPKRLFPKEYITKYHITNLWKYDLISGWRLIYTITADNEVEVLAAVLDWFDHKEYERTFKY